MSNHLIDPYCKYKNGSLVLKDDMLYSCVLNQTDLTANKNKFYIMQLVQQSHDLFIHFIRYGRIGEPGTVIEKKHSDLASAIAAFEKQFRAKTGNRWEYRNRFIKKKGRYAYTAIDYDLNGIPVVEETEIDLPDSNLTDEVKYLVELLSNLEMMKKTMVNLNLDVQRLPLGKLQTSQLKRARAVLEVLVRQINRQTGLTAHTKTWESFQEDIIELSSSYYTLIPMMTGRTRPPLINTLELVFQYVELLDDLTNIVTTNQIIKKPIDGIHPADHIYGELQTEIKKVGLNTKPWKAIKRYITNTHAPTHTFKLKLLDIYSIKRYKKEERFIKKTKGLENHQLLIHGSRLSNWASILRTGFLLDPSRLGVYISGKMFGYGIYFANSFSKAAQYAGVKPGTKEVICLALAEVALGKESKQTKADPYMTIEKLAGAKKDSVWGQGKMTPQSMQTLKIADKIVSVPNGKLVPSKIESDLKYDEKIVYDTNQFCLRYLVLLEMDNT